jgi:hypothetical protein
MLDRIYPKPENQFLKHGVDQFTYDETEKLPYDTCDYSSDLLTLEDYISISREYGLKILIYRGYGIYCNGYEHNRRYLALYKDVPVWTCTFPRYEWRLFNNEMRLLDDVEHNEDWTDGHAWMIPLDRCYIREPVFRKCIELIKKYIDESGFSREKFASLGGERAIGLDEITNPKIQDITDPK